MWPIPVRYAAALGAATVCACLAIMLHYQTPGVQENEGFMIGAPAPPPVYFAEAFLVIPGAVAGLPLAVTGAILEREWLAQTGLVLGATFFWYCVGRHIDSNRGALLSEKAPPIVRWYMSALIGTSVVLFPLSILAGLRLGVHSCANGAYPYWVDLLSYGILMFWITVGTYFGWRRRQARKEQEHSPALFRI
jgi:hypothetical protein